MTREEQIAVLRLERNYTRAQYRHYTQQLLHPPNPQDLTRLRTERNVASNHYVEVVERLRTCKEHKL